MHPCPALLSSPPQPARRTECAARQDSARAPPAPSLGPLLATASLPGCFPTQRWAQPPPHFHPHSSLSGPSGPPCSLGSPAGELTSPRPPDDAECPQQGQTEGPATFRELLFVYILPQSKPREAMEGFISRTGRHRWSVSPGLQHTA